MNGLIFFTWSELLKVLSVADSFVSAEVKSVIEFKGFIQSRT